MLQIRTAILALSLGVLGYGQIVNSGGGGGGGGGGGTCATLTGDVSGSCDANTVNKLNGIALSGLATGILKNTTTTGAPSIAVAGDFPTLNQNTSGTAANLSGTPALPNGTTATTQTASDNSNKLATTAYVDSALTIKAIGSAIFNGTGGIANATYKGIVSSVTRASTGTYTVNFSSITAASYTVAVMACSDNAATTSWYIAGTSGVNNLGATSFIFNVINTATGTVRDSGCVAVTMFQ